MPHCGKYTFEVLSSRLKPGCAESSIVNGLLELDRQRTQGGRALDSMLRSCRSRKEMFSHDASSSRRSSPIRRSLTCREFVIAPRSSAS